MIRVLLTATIFLFTSIVTYSQDSNEALQYMTNITNSLENFRAQTWDILKSTIDHRSSATLDMNLGELVDDIQTERERITADPGYYGDLSIKVAMKTFLRSSAQIITEEYSEINRLRGVSQHSYKNMEGYFIAQDNANKKLRESGERLDSELKKFADRYQVLVTDDKYVLAEKINKSSKALSYYNNTFLAFFKAFDKKTKIYSALKSGNLETVRTENNELVETCLESLEMLENQSDFYGDKDLWVAADNLINQFLFEANEVHTSAIRAIEKKNIYDMARMVFDQKPENERTQNDANHINSLIDPLNKAIEEQNQKLSSSELKRQELMNNWNLAINNFFSAYLN